MSPNLECREEFKEWDEEGEFEFDTVEEFMQAVYSSSPTRLLTIFGQFMNFLPSEITSQIVGEFVYYGLDLDYASVAYRSDTNERTTPLDSACEFRYANVIKALLENDAHPTKDTLSSVLIGHSYNDVFDLESCEMALRELVPYLSEENKVISYEVERTVGIENFPHFRGNEYIKNILDTFRFEEFIVFERED